MTSDMCFDVAAGEELKRQGLANAVRARPMAFGAARQAARFLGERGWQFVTMDDVFEHGFPKVSAIDLGNAAGAVFRERCWRLTPKRVKSRRTSNHAREIKVWEFVGL